MTKLFALGIITISLPFGFVSQPPAVNSGVSSNSSRNWSGYESTGGRYTAVSGTWTIPNVPSATSTEADATWVGIGGVSSQDLIQAGTQAVINGDGAPAYQAWYETLPQATQQVPLTVSPGDSMTASLTETSSASGNSPAEWAVSIRDNTTGQSYQTSIAYNSSLSSAEWIEEMPTSGNSLVPIDNFGSVSFLSGMTTENGNPETISGANSQSLIMVNGAGQSLATTSSLGSDGASFTVTRTAADVVSGFAGGGSGSGYYVVGGRGGLGRGWRRTGVGIQGFAPQPQLQPQPAAPSSSSLNGFYQQELSQLLQELRQLQSSNSYLRNTSLRRGW